MDVIVNFKGNDPVAGGARYDRVPEGTYRIKCIKAEPAKTSTEKPALNVTIQIVAGAFKGKKVREMFVLPRKGTNDSPFGVQRLHGFMVACGIKRQTGKVSLKKIATALTNKECVAEIADSTLPETDSQKERVVSSPQAYYSLKSKEGKAALSPKAAPADDDEAEDEDTEEDADDEGDEDDEDSDGEAEDDDEDEDDEEEETPRKKTTKSAKSKGKSASKKSKKPKDADDEDSEDDDDDLYEDDEDEDD